GLVFLISNKASLGEVKPARISTSGQYFSKSRRNISTQRFSSSTMMLLMGRRIVSIGGFLIILLCLPAYYPHQIYRLFLNRFLLWILSTCCISVTGFLQASIHRVFCG